MTDLYLDQPGKNSWWHYVAALKSASGREYGVQCTRFLIKGRELFHCAVTDVQEQKHDRYAYSGGLSRARAYVVHYPEGDEHGIEFRGVELVFLSAPIFHYKSETSTHYGIPRAEVVGTINGESVSGMGCFDREIFDRLLKPDEVGWHWRVCWWDDGETNVAYEVYDKFGNARSRLVGGDSLEFAKKVPLVTEQHWPQTPQMVGYSERLCSFEHNGRTGRGYVEDVGFWGWGIPDL